MSLKLLKSALTAKSKRSKHKGTRTPSWPVLPPTEKALPSAPGVYQLFRNGQVVYIGQSRNLARRISQYRNAKRIKKHKKMLKIRNSSDSIQWTVCHTHQEAKRLEIESIQKWTPKLNLEFKFWKTYPMVFLGQNEPKNNSQSNIWILGLSLRGEPTSEHYGAFRSRDHTREFLAELSSLLGLLGYVKRLKFKRYRISGIDERLMMDLRAFLLGDSNQFLEHLVLCLSDQKRARLKPKVVQESLRVLLRFWKFEIVPLTEARNRSGYPRYPVERSDRDRLVRTHKL